ncbi:YggS family pyridoxal phosphate-dependent enzyme [Paenibacillus cymbidii]|uniref:YggS family pyridoxal phosphate-dependent enzyme n=1 Tax=Paenibacillus cymbidii TaxID=1639034 RepID=UPI001081D368|nr:YggS family pyridoxal phosphate-dependent enzyme [Paenibacillus cymbidii]
MSIKDRLLEVNRRIEAACQRAGRRPEEVNLVAVTKYVEIGTAREAFDSGLRHLGENRWQDAKLKWETIGDAVWHFIGHLQTNKVKDVIGKFPYIHSLDRDSLADEMNRKAVALGICVNAFVQVNVSGEESKYGLPPDELFRFAERLADKPGIRVVGLMTMAPHEAQAEATRPVFRELRRLRDELNARNILPYIASELSMGMSNDFEVAVEEGATWIRLGSVLVGHQ